MSFYSWKPYVPVAARRAQALKTLARMREKGQAVEPVRVEGRAIAKSFWGKSWCENLERYSDYENRLPRGRTYARNGSVLDLQIRRGEAIAKVIGSSLYTVKVAITPVAKPRWKAIVKDCAGAIDSLVELLQGRLDKGVMERVCRPGDGLFPAPSEIKMSCSCLDWADMCKHVAATLYGIGARLDQKPELLFALRAVDEKQLITSLDFAALGQSREGTERVLVEDDMAALFGLDMAGANVAGGGVPAVKAKPRSETPKPAAAKPKSRTPAVARPPPPKPIKAKRRKRPAKSSAPQAARARRSGTAARGPKRDKPPKSRL
jgi:uncharacterized Zn finger protein